GLPLDDVVERLVFGAYYQSGQSCISVQHILAHHDVYDALRRKLKARVGKLVMGDPRDENTFIGPVIDEAAARRIEGWVEAARKAGARRLAGGPRQGNMLPATLMENVPPDCDLYRQEVFGPVACLQPFDDFDAALDTVNASDFGLQAGVFTAPLDHAMRAWDRLEVGGVVDGHVPSFRVDNMPYGGAMQSGGGLRAAGGRVARPARPGHARLGPARGRRCGGRRRAELPRRQHALRRREAVRPRARRREVRERGHDRTAPARHPRPAGNLSMCLVAVAWRTHPRWPPALVATRDEPPDRPAAPPRC